MRPAAQAIRQVVEAENPPLPLGSDAIEYAALAGNARDESDARWRELSMSIAAPDGNDEVLQQWQGGPGNDAPWHVTRP